MRVFEVVAVAFLAALAVLLQFSHNFIGLPMSVTGFMWVDLVGVPALLAFFLFGFEHALYVSVLTALAITFAAPDSWLGASTKFAGTMSMIIVPATYALYRKNLDAGKLAAILVVGTAYSLTAFVLSGAVNLASQAWVEITDPLLLGVLPVLAIALYSVALHALWSRQKRMLRADEFAKAKVLLEVLAVSLVVRGLVMTVVNYYYAGPLFFGQATQEIMRALPWERIFFWNAVQGSIEVLAAWGIAFPAGFEKKYGSW
ncbi:MAG: hypothetical protein QXH27_03375 [Candidatus Micrarchaeia archaeon]